MNELMEQVTIVTPLGIRFWDPVLNMQVGDNLTVTARPEETGFPVIPAVQTRSGIYAFRGLPGLHDVEYPVDDEYLNRFLSGQTTFASSPPHAKRFVIEVEDQLDRFLKIAFYADLPYRGIFLDGIFSAFGSPPMSSPPIAKIPGFYLFPAPTRTAASGLAAVRGQLIEEATKQPAAYALLEITVKGERRYGIADERGCFIVLFPYPTFTSTIITSSPPVRRLLPFPQQWDITIRVFYTPSTVTYPGVKVPEFRHILDQKYKQGFIWSKTTERVSELTKTLTFGQEIILRTADLAESILWIDKGS